ncbi:hypothetical protein FJTKL_02989 [Diaporthe vaccinii]|uniref:C2H2-type domain-containing protein n=1 Tax=Diaporthe vaccinii TaxID=105482 RepID=A0ABR4DWF9_9PEZI
MADFNSDDEIAMDPPPPDPYAHLGAKSIEAMFETRFEDRVKTKRRMANLQDTIGSPNTVRARAIWTKRFESYLTRIRGLSVDHVPTGEDIARFLESISNKITSQIPGKSGVSVEHMRRAVYYIHGGLVFKQDFRLTRHESRRLDTLIDTLAKEGKLTTGKWRPRQRVGFVLLQKMGQAWFRKHLTYGCLSWDVVISKFLPLVLMSSTVSRVGDIGRSSYYTGCEYLRWEHIVLILEGDEPEIKNMVAKITIEYEKGSNPQYSWYLPRLHLPCGLHQVGRTVKAAGLLAGILTPLVTHDVRRGASRDVAKLPSEAAIRGVASPTVAKALGHNYKSLHMGVTDTYVGAIETAINASVAVNHTPDRFGPPIADQGYFRRKPVKPASITEYCTNDDQLDPSLVKDRATASRRIQEQEAQQWVEEQGDILRGGPGAATALASRQQKKRKDSSSSYSTAPPGIVGHPVTNPLAERSPNILLPAGPLALAPAPDAKKRKRGKNNANPTAVDPNSASSGLNGVQTGLQPSPGAVSAAGGQPPPQASVPDELIDPQLLLGADADPDMSVTLSKSGVQEHLIDSTPVSHVMESSLQSMILGNDNDETATGQEAGAPEEGDPQSRLFEEYVDDQVIDDAMNEIITETTSSSDRTAAAAAAAAPPPPNDPASAVTLPDKQFVDYFARINVVRNMSLRHSLTKLAEAFPRHVGMGNSRDEPTLFLVPCPNAASGCSYSHPNQELVDKHEVGCSIRLAAKLKEGKGGLEEEEEEQQEVVAVHPFHCDRSGCTRKFKKKTGLDNHMKRDHDWVPKKCELSDCPKPDVEWTTGTQLSNHIIQDHDKDWTPSKCTYPGCPSLTVFAKRHLYSSHLQHVYKLRGAEKQKYEQARRPFKKGKCPVNSCDPRMPTFWYRAVLEDHLKAAHGLGDDEIAALIEAAAAA